MLSLSGNIYLDQINNKVFMSKFDFVLTALQDLSSQEWECCVLIPNDAPVLVLSKGHPWSERKEIALEEAASEPFILLPKIIHLVVLPTHYARSQISLPASLQNATTCYEHNYCTQKKEL